MSANLPLATMVGDLIAALPDVPTFFSLLCGLLRSLLG